MISATLRPAGAASGLGFAESGAVTAGGLTDGGRALSFGLETCVAVTLYSALASALFGSIAKAARYSLEALSFCPNPERALARLRCDHRNTGLSCMDLSAAARASPYFRSPRYAEARLLKAYG
jgi:hypothetical protein